MKINKKKIKKYASSTLLTMALSACAVLSINEYTVNHNDTICYLTRIFGYEHQISKINNNPDNIKNNVFAVYSPKLYILPDGYILDYDDHIGYKCEKSHIAHDMNDTTRTYVVPDNIITLEPTFEPVPNIEIVKIDESSNKRTIIKALKLKWGIMEDLRFTSNNTTYYVIATYYDEEYTKKNYIIYTDKKLQNNKLQVYYGMYEQKDEDSIKLLDIQTSLEKKVALSFLKEVMKTSK